MVTAIHQVSIFRRHSGGLVWSLNLSGSVPAIDVVGRRAGFQPQLCTQQINNTTQRCIDSPRGKEGELPLVLAATSRALLIPFSNRKRRCGALVAEHQHCERSLFRPPNRHAGSRKSPELLLNSAPPYRRSATIVLGNGKGC